LEPLHGRLQRQHADAHGVIPQRRGEPVHGFGNFQNVRVVAAPGDLAQTGLHRHQFADQVHQLIQLVDRNAQDRHSGGATGVGLRALFFRDPLDGQLAIVFDENEDVAYRFGAGGRGQNHVPGQVTAFRVDLAQRRNSRGVQRDSQCPQFAQLAREEQRIRASL
jgi:hypothetical protein